MDQDQEINPSAIRVADFCESAVKEYLKEKGYTKTLESFNKESEQSKVLSFQVYYLLFNADLPFLYAHHFAPPPPPPTPNP